MKIMSWDVQMEPLRARPARLDAVPVGKGDEKKPIGPQKLPGSSDGLDRIGQVLQRMPKYDDVEISWRIGCLEEIAYLETHAVLLQSFQGWKIHDFISMDFPSPFAHGGEEVCSSPASDIEQSPMRHEAKNPLRPPEPGEMNEDL